MGTPSMNLLRGTLQDGVVRAGDLSLRVAGAADGAVVVGFRPEALLPAQQGAGLPQVQMTVEVVEELGNETLIYGEVPGEVATVEIDPTLPAPLPGARARLCARLSGFSDVRPGERVPLALRLDRVHLFEAAGLTQSGPATSPLPSPPSGALSRAASGLP
jgi:ABC-type sugar transport system ATPase subunit